MEKKKIKIRKTRQFILLLSFLVFPLTIYYFSPYLPIQGASEGIVSGSLLLFGGFFLFSFIFGRAFCGWVCPAGALQEYAARIKDKPARGRGWNLIKYIVWIPWLAIIVLMFIRAGGVKQIDPLYMTEKGISVASLSAWILYYSVVGLILLMALFGRKRSFCHSLCWMAPFMLTGNWIRSKWKVPSLHLEAEKSKCIKCGVCEKNCPMSLPVQSMVQKGDMYNSECILCGECVTGCAQNSIRFAWKHKS